MNTELLIGLTTFAFVSSVTPGPNNLMLMASGANFGFRRSIPHLLGVALGFVLMVVLVGVGLVEIFDRFPVSYVILKVLSVVYLLYLAWRIATAPPPVANVEHGKPIGFLAAAAFQWVNPKAWAMALTAVTVYSASHELGEIALVAVIFGIINLPSTGSWAWLGQEMQRVLTSPGRLRAFNVLMALLLVASLYPVIVTQAS